VGAPELGLGIGSFSSATPRDCGMVFMQPADGITLGDLSRRIGRDKGALSRAAKEGRIPRNADGTYDEMAVRAAIEKSFNPARDKPLLPVGGVADVADNGEVTTE